jgi:hypothetical protein
MSTTANAQLEAIHAMMASGHRSVRIERHTLLLWGLAAAFLILVVDVIFSKERFPEVWLRSLSANAFIAVVLTGVAIWDYRLTRHARRQRDESLSFVQQQLMKVWWLLVGLIVLINFGMNFFGGGYMFFGVLLAVMGIAFYVHGLFSQQMLSWTGLLLIGLGLASVALKLPYAVMEWLAFFVFGLGLPLLALLLPRTGNDATLQRRMAAALVWLTLVLVPTAIVYEWNRRVARPVAQATELAAFQRQPEAATGLQVVRLPAGTLVPVQIEISGDVLEGAGTAILPMRLARSIELALRDGELDGRFRVGDDEWKQRLYNLRVHRTELSATLRPADGPRVALKARFGTRN